MALEDQGKIEILIEVREALARIDELEKDYRGALQAMAKATEEGLDPASAEFEALRAKVEQAGSALEAAGDEGAAAMKRLATETGVSLERINGRVDEILAGLGKWGPEVAASADKASGALTELGAKSEQGLGAGQRAAVAARLAVDDYRATLERAKDAGATIADEQIAELNQLEAEYKLHVARLGDMRRAQEDVGKAVKQSSADVGGQIPQIRSLDDALEQAGGKVGAIRLKLGALAVAFETGWRAGEQLRRGLNAISDGRFDEGVKRLADKYFELAGAKAAAAGEAERVKNMQAVLRTQGIDPSTLSVEALEAAYVKAITAMRDKRVAIDEQRDANREWAESLRAPKEELDKQTAAVLAHAEVLKNATAQLSGKEQQIAFRKTLLEPVQDLLAAYADVEAAPPRALAELGKWLGVATEAQDKAAASADRLAASEKAAAAAMREAAAAAEQGPARNVFGQELDPAAAQKSVDALRKRREELEAELQTGAQSGEVYEELAAVKEQLVAAEVS